MAIDFDLYDPLEGSRRRDLEEDILPDLDLANIYATPEARAAQTAIAESRPSEPTYDRGTGLRGVVGTLIDRFGRESAFRQNIGADSGDLDREFRELTARPFEPFGDGRTVATSAAGGGTAGTALGGAGDEFEQAIRQLATYLNQPVFTESDEARRRALRFDNLERQRAAAKQQVVERLAAMGHAQSSGTVEQALGLVDQRFDAFRTQGEASLLDESLQLGERRKKDALSTLLLIPQLRRQADILKIERERIAAAKGAAAAQSQGDLMEGLGMLLGLILKLPVLA